jgi:hypothetical protein
MEVDEVVDNGPLLDHQLHAPDIRINLSYFISPSTKSPILQETKDHERIYAKPPRINNREVNLTALTTRSPFRSETRHVHISIDLEIHRLASLVDKHIVSGDETTIEFDEVQSFVRKIVNRSPHIQAICFTFKIHCYDFADSAKITAYQRQEVARMIYVSNILPFRLQFEDRGVHVDYEFRGYFTLKDSVQSVSLVENCVEYQALCEDQWPVLGTWNSVFVESDHFNMEDTIMEDAFDDETTENESLASMKVEEQPSPDDKEVPAETSRCIIQ